MEILTSPITIGAITSIILLIISKQLPNEKIAQFGFKIGTFLTTFGGLKMGKTWEKIEDFLINSVGVFMEGIKAGLNSDETKNVSVKKSKRNTKIRK